MTALAVLAADAGVDTGIVSAAGLAVGGGGILLTALWLHYFYR